MKAVKCSDLIPVFRQHLCRRIMHMLHILLNRDLKWILMVIILSTGSLEGLSVETVLMWEFPILNLIFYGYFISSPKK
jgi:hypothetical protein